MAGYIFTEVEPCITCTLADLCEKQLTTCHAFDYWAMNGFYKKEDVAWILKKDGKTVDKYALM
jgi:hypothetical protein